MYKVIVVLTCMMDVEVLVNNVFKRDCLQIFVYERVVKGYLKTFGRGMKL